MAKRLSVNRGGKDVPADASQAARMNGRAAGRSQDVEV